MSSFNDSLASEPHCYLTLNAKGLALANTRKYEEALKCFDDAIQLEPEWFAAWANRACLEKEEGDWETALQNYNKALEFDPSSAEIWFERAELVSCMKDEGKTREDLINAYNDLIAKCIPDDYYYPMALYLRSGELYMLGRYDEALKSYDSTLIIDPDNNDAWEEKGNLFKELGRIEESEVCYAKARSILREIEKKCVELLRNLGRYDLIDRNWKNLIERHISILPKLNFSEDGNKINHDEIIYALAKITLAIGLQVHIGKKEQSTSTWNGEAFRNLSLSNLPIQKTLKDWERDKIQQIDLIWFDSSNDPVYAFEVETTTTIVSGIDRFIELLKIYPNMAKKIVLIIPPKRLNKINKLLKESHYIGLPLYMENKLMYCLSDHISQIYQNLSDKTNLDLQKVLETISNFIVSPNTSE